MQLRRHEWADCPDCGARLWYGMKAEATGWTVYYECDCCRFEKRVGRVAMADVDSHDAAERRAAAMGERV